MRHKEVIRLVYAIAKLTEIELELITKIKMVNEAEKSTDSEVISNIRRELDMQLQSIQEAIEELKEVHRNIIY